MEVSSHIFIQLGNWKGSSLDDDYTTQTSVLKSQSIKEIKTDLKLGQKPIIVKLFFLFIRMVSLFILITACNQNQTECGRQSDSVPVVKLCFVQVEWWSGMQPQEEQEKSVAVQLKSEIIQKDQFTLWKTVSTTVRSHNLQIDSRDTVEVKIKPNRELAVAHYRGISCCLLLGGL